MDYAFSYDDIADAYAAGVDSAPYNALYERPAMLDLLENIALTDRQYALTPPQVRVLSALRQRRASPNGPAS